MKPSSFDYIRAGTVAEATAALAGSDGGVRVLAGGLSLVAILNFRLAEPETLIDISRISELAYIRVDGDALEVGAATTQAELQSWPGLAEKVPLLAAAFPYIGHYQTRSRGTVCGSLAHADPSSELPLCLAALGGEVLLRSARAERRLGADEFQTGMLSTARRDDEMVTAARFPLAKAGAGYGFTEMAQRRGDFAIVALAAIATGDGLRLAVGGVADRPTVRDFSDSGGGDLAGDELDQALNAFAWELGGYDDIHASARYRRELVRRLGRRVIEEARTCRD